MLQINTSVQKNTKFKTAAIGCFLRLPLTNHNLAYASLLAHLQMNASLFFPSIRLQQEALASLYDLQFEVVPQLFGNRLLLSYLANFIEPTEILDPDYSYAEVIEKLALIIEHPIFNQDLLNFTRKQMIDDYRELMEEPSNYALDRFFKLWYKDDPDFAETFMGSLTEINNATPVKLNLFNQSLKEMPTAIIASAKYPSELKKVIDISFKQAGLIKEFSSDRITIPAPKLELTKSEQKNNLQAQLLMGYAFKKPLNYQQQVDGIVLAQYLAGDQSSILFTKIREKLRAAYAVEANNYANNSLFLVSAGLAPDKVEAAQDIIQKEMKQIAASQIDQDLLKKVKRALLNLRLINDDQQNWQINQQLRAELLPGYRDFDRFAAIKKTTGQSISAFVKNLFLNESYVLK